MQVIHGTVGDDRRVTLLAVNSVRINVLKESSEEAGLASAGEEVRERDGIETADELLIQMGKASWNEGQRAKTTSMRYTGLRLTMKSEISRTSTVIAAQEQVWCELVGETVILHLKSNIYYGLNAVGARIWSLIQKPTTVSVILDTLLEEYDVAPDLCESDLVALLRELNSRDLIEVKPAPNGTAK